MKKTCKNKEYYTSRIKIKTSLSIALGSVLNVRLAAVTKLPKKLLLSKESSKTSKWVLLLAGCTGAAGFNSARNLTVQVNTQERLEVLIRDLPHSKGLLGGVGQQAQQDDDGVLRWDGKEVDITAMTQSKGTASPETSCSLIPLFAGQGGLEKLCYQEMMVMWIERGWACCAWTTLWWVMSTHGPSHAWGMLSWSSWCQSSNSKAASGNAKPQRVQPQWFWDESSVEAYKTSMPGSKALPQVSSIWLPYIMG